MYEIAALVLAALLGRAVFLRQASTHVRRRDYAAHWDRVMLEGLVFALLELLLLDPRPPSTTALLRLARFATATTWTMCLMPNGLIPRVPV